MDRQHRDNHHAVIIGAGVAGLSNAWWLSLLGWQVTLVERAADLRSDGYMIGLSGPGYQAAEKMGILQQLQQFNMQIEENLYLDSTGREILRLRYPELLNAIDWLTLSRADLVHTLYEKVTTETETRLLFSTELTAYDAQKDNVIVSLINGESLQADLLIGADGVHSKLRQQLFPQQDCLEPLGYRVAAFQTDDCLHLQRDFLSYAQPGHLAEFYTLKQGRLASLYLWKDAETERPADRQAAQQVLQQRFADSHPNTLHWVEQLPEDAPLFFDHLTMVKLPQWSSGRVLLVGDAAHCLTLLSGQGAGMAMMSAYVLAQKLKQHNIDNALVQHDAQLRPAIDRLQQRSRDIAPWFIPATQSSFLRRNWLLKWLPKKLIGWYFLRAIRADIVAASTT